MAGEGQTVRHFCTERQKLNVKTSDGMAKEYKTVRHFYKERQTSVVKHLTKASKGVKTSDNLGHALPQELRYSYNIKIMGNINALPQ